jgi:hypothetical protein
MSPHSGKYWRQLAASFIYVTRSNRLPTGQMILDIGDLLADRRQLKHLVFDNRIVGLFGKFPIHHRLVPQIVGWFHRAQYR